MQIFGIKNKRKSCTAVFTAMQLFNILSFSYFFVAFLRKQATFSKPLMCGFSVLFVCLPSAMEKLFHFQAPRSVYIFCLLYAVCPMLGHSYNLYYLLPFFDKLLHLSGGVVFAVFGAYLPKAFLKENQVNYKLCALTGLLFSMAVACVWEFVEFGIDELFLADMQKDTIVGQVHSYKLGEVLGKEVGEIAQVDRIGILINGEHYIDGYIDIGRMDTMCDLLIETAGASGFFALYIIGKGKRFCLNVLPKEEKAKTVGIEIVSDIVVCK